MKTFTFAGTCTENGATVYKFANDAKRAKALERFGCTNVNMIELPAAMDKEAAVAYLAQVGMTATQAVRIAKTATVKVKASKQTQVIAKKVKRVPSELKAGMDPAEFAAKWFAARPTAEDIAEALAS
jgi:hypothetical protein